MKKNISGRDNEFPTAIISAVALYDETSSRLPIQQPTFFRFELCGPDLGYHTPWAKFLSKQYILNHHLYSRRLTCEERPLMADFLGGSCSMMALPAGLGSVGSAWSTVRAINFHSNNKKPRTSIFDQVRAHNVRRMKSKKSIGNLNRATRPRFDSNSISHLHRGVGDFLCFLAVLTINRFCWSHPITALRPMGAPGERTELDGRTSLGLGYSSIHEHLSYPGLRFRSSWHRRLSYLAIPSVFPSPSALRVSSRSLNQASFTSKFYSVSRIVISHLPTP